MSFQHSLAFASDAEECGLPSNRNAFEGAGPKGAQMHRAAVAEVMRLEAWLDRHQPSPQSGAPSEEDYRVALARVEARLDALYRILAACCEGRAERLAPGEAA